MVIIAMDIKCNIKMLIIIGLIFIFALDKLQAATLSYLGEDTQGYPATSKITATEQIGNLFFVRIEGGMPDINPSTGNPYLRVLRFTEFTHNQAYAIFFAPFLYIFTPAQINNQKLVVDVSHTYVFFWQGQNRFQLIHIFREDFFCDAQPCTNEEEIGLFCGKPVCQLKSETISFEMPVIYIYEE